MKPRSMEIFDYLFFGSLLVSIFHFIFAWDRMLLDGTGEASAVMPDMTVFFIIGAVFGFGLVFLLWFFVSAKGSNVARWIYTVLTGLGVAMAVVELAILPTSEIVLSMITNGLAAASIAFLFRSDSADWFAGDSGRWNASTFD